MVSTEIKLEGLDTVLVVTSHADAAAADEVDTRGHRNKRSIIRALTVGGNPVAQLIRLQVSHGKLYIDIVEDEDVANLDTLVGAMDLSGSAAGHPSPTEDVVDTNALAAAAS